MMTSFNVGNGGELGIQRLGEFKLEGRLLIKELQNIENSQDALKADLKNKTRLVTLDLSWERNGISVDSEKEEDVIEKLEPSRNLKCLSITNYGGKQFPNWFLENSLRNMVSLELRECKSCQRLPSLGLLPLLKDLKIAELDGIVSIDADFQGNNSSSFESLETLKFSSMKEWEKRECTAMTGAFPRIRELSISYCPKLKGELPKINVPLERLYIRDCQQLDACAPKALRIDLQDCGKLVLDGATVRRLRMEASWSKNVGSKNLDHLEIYSCLESISDDCVSLSRKTFPLHFFPKLMTLVIVRFGNLETISCDRADNNLNNLIIVECPKFELLHGDKLPSLNYLHIDDCPKLVGSLKRAFGDYSCLNDLHIENLDAECFPDEGLLPFSLTTLTIWDSPNLKTLTYNGLHQLSSLKTLNIGECPNLLCLPEKGLPKSISHLSIHGCPVLEKRCQEGGEDWRKIAHIQHLDLPDSMGDFDDLDE